MIHPFLPTLLVGLMLTGCGGDSKQDSSSAIDSTNTTNLTDTTNTSASTANIQLSGAVVDGYIQNAKVCLDKNHNAQCDDSEPYTHSDAHGSYQLEIPAEDESLYPLIAEIGTDAIDLDAPNTPIEIPYRLTTPIGKEHLISPLTTLAKSLQSKQVDLTTDQAEQTILANLGLYEGNAYRASIYENYLPKEAENNDYALLHKVAQEIIKGTSGYISQLNRQGISADERALIILSLTADAAVENLGALKEISLNQTGSTSGIFNLPLTEEQLELSANGFELTKNVSDVDLFFLKGEGHSRWVEFELARMLEQSRMRIYDFATNKREEVFGPAESSIASYNQPIAQAQLSQDFPIDPFLQAFFSSPQFKTIDLSAKTFLMKDLVLPEYYTDRFDGKTVSFGFGDKQLVINGTGSINALSFPDEICQLTPVPMAFKCFNETSSLSGLADFIHQHASKETALESNSDNPQYFVPKDPSDWKQGGAIWRFNQADQQAYYVRDYQVIHHNQKDYLLWGSYARPFEDVVTLIENGQQWEVEYVARPGAKRWLTFNASAAEKLLQAIKSALAEAAP